MTALPSVLLALTSLTIREQANPALEDCARLPATVRIESSTSPVQTTRLAAASRLLEQAYPSLRMQRFRDSLYVIDNGTPYGVRLHYDYDSASGYAALVIAYKSKHEEALDTGEKLNGDGCRSPMELVVARVDSTGSPRIIARGQLDDEASAIDVRTIDVDVDDAEPAVTFVYFAYYGRPGWFGFVGWRASVGIDRGRLITHRLPASYLKVSRPEHRMEGYLAPAAGGDLAHGIARLETAAFGTRGEVEKQFDVPLIEGRWISGVEILRQVP